MIPVDPATALPKVKIPEIIGSALLSALFAGAFILALGWPTQAAIFPLGVTALGALLSATYCIMACLRRPAAPEAAPAGLNLGDNDEDSDDDIDHLFSTAPARDWMIALGFLGGFFVCLYLFGLYAAAAMFTAVYLRSQARSSWRFTLIYAGALTAGLYGIFSLVLRLPVPEGLLGL